MKICICDDDLRIHDEIKQLIGEFFSQNDIPDFSDFSTGEELLLHYSKDNEFDIIFLDVEMSEMTVGFNPYGVVILSNTAACFNKLCAD